MNGFDKSTHLRCCLLGEIFSVDNGTLFLLVNFFAYLFACFSFAAIFIFSSSINMLLSEVTDCGDCGDGDPKA